MYAIRSYYGEEPVLMEKTQNAIVETDEENVNDEISKLVKFNKPYKFEDETYNSIDLSGLDDLTTTDLIAAESYNFV